MMHGGWMHNYGIGGFFGYCSYWPIIIAVILGVIWLLRGRNNSKNGLYKSKALETLTIRLAKGEITEEEYDRVKRKLEE